MKSETEWLEEFQPNEFDTVLFSVDPVIFTIKNKQLCVLLVKRKYHPYSGRWALPGGRVDKTKCSNLEEAVRAKLFAKTGLEQAYFEQIETEGNSFMDPRGWSVTTTYMALARFDDVLLSSNETGEDVEWQPVNKLDELGELAFWHNSFIDAALQRLRDKITYTDLPVYLVSKRFTIRQLREAYEVLLDKPITRQVFNKRADKLIKEGVLIDTGDKTTEDGGRPAPVYKAKEKDSAHIFDRTMKRS